VSESQGAEPCVVVVGGANTDVVGHPFAPLVAHDSNPGFVEWSAGGVGRNIADNLARLGVTTHLVTAMGGDFTAQELAAECSCVGVALDYVLVVPELPGSLYVAILDERGEMEVALSDMRALERITPDVLAERGEAFERASLVVADANISAESLEWLVQEVAAPVLLDPVSTAKAARAQGILDRLAALKCNTMEAAEILGVPQPHSQAQIAYIAEKLLEEGVSSVYITAGALGVQYCSAEETGWFPRPTDVVVNATGAGDAFSAGVAAGMLEGMGARGCAAFGSALAGMTLASARTVSDAVSRTAVREAMEALGR